MTESKHLSDIKSGAKKIGIVGQGYVGLPLAVAFADAGLPVLGFDIDPAKVERINQGKSYILDVTDAELKPLVEKGLIVATADFDRLAECSAVSICVPTPLSKTKEPDVSYIEAAISEIRKRLQPGQLIVLESTTYPGTTDELVQPKLEEGGLKAGSDFHLAFSPERVDPGNPQFKVHNTPKIIGGITPECTARALELYSAALEHVHPVSSTKAAELVKLLENTFRAVNIGFINEFAQMCQRLNVDVWEVIEAAKTKPFGFMAFYPGPGLGGHCIPIDPIYLSWKMSRLDYKAQFIDLADTINSHMPVYVIREVMEQLNDSELALKGSRVLILGMAYKENISDTRESPAIDVAALLLDKGAKVVFHDPYVPVCTVRGRELHNHELTDELLAEADLVMILTAHKNIDYARVVDKAQRIYDTKSITRKLELSENHKVRRL